MKFDKLIDRLIKEDFENKELEGLCNFLKTFHSEGRIVLTNKETVENVNIEQIPTRPYSYPKPKGIWYSLASEWVEFLIYQAPEWASNYTNVFLLDIDFSKILKIDSTEKFETFNKDYANGIHGDWFVDWTAIQKEGYKGVEIIPYQMDYRDITWYNQWDVASGCIWDSSCIKNTTKVYPS